MRHHLVLRVITKMLIPPILLFALYVQFHGDFGPGGGFQAGLETARRTVPIGLLRFLVAFGFLLYALVGVAGLILGGNYLDYSVLASNPTAGQHLGVITIELGVGITVAAVMIAVFFSFAGRSPKIRDEDW